MDTSALKAENEELNLRIAELEADRDVWEQDLREKFAAQIDNLHGYMKKLQADEIERLTNRVNDRDCEIERLRVFAKKGPYDESAATRAMLLQADNERLRADMKDIEILSDRLEAPGWVKLIHKTAKAALREDE